MEQKCLFSIVIPVYNGANVVSKSLDSVYSQRLSNDIFEVICVDDCSTEVGCMKVLNSYTFEGNRPENLFIFRNTVNKKSGGARNNGVAHARGLWIVYLDCDDTFWDGSLERLQKVYESHKDLDVIIYNFKSSISDSGLNNLSLEKMSGLNFIKTQPVPWFACCYSYRREFLAKNHIQFVEDVFYEDTDYAFRAISKAKFVKFFNIKVFMYELSEGQASKVNTPKKIFDMFDLTQRLFNISTDFRDNNRDVEQAILGHYNYKYYMNLKRFLWRFSYNIIISVLSKYPPKINTKSFFLVKMVASFPRLYALLAMLGKPLFYVYLKLK